MVYGLVFAPWILFYVFGTPYSPVQQSLTLAATITLVAAAALVVAIRKLGRDPTLPVAATATFLILVLLAWAGDPEAVEPWAPALVYASLAGIVTTGAVRGRPFIVGLSRGATADVVRISTAFVRLATLLAWLVAGLAAAVAVASAVAGSLDPSRVTAALYLVPPALAAVAAGLVMDVSLRRYAQKRIATRLGRLNVALSDTDPLIDFIDVISIKVPRHQAAAIVEGLLAVGLPRAWLPVDAVQGTSHGFRLGNLNVEVLAVDTASAPRVRLMFEPVSLAGLEDAVRARGLGPAELESSYASNRLIRKHISVAAASSDRLGVDLSAPMDTTRSDQAQAPHNQASIARVAQVSVTVAREQVEAWRRLLAPFDAHQRVSFSAGPQLLARAGTTTALESVTVRVDDPAAAAAALSKAGLSVDGTRLHIAQVRFDLTPASSSWT